MDFGQTVNQLNVSVKCTLRSVDSKDQSRADAILSTAVTWRWKWRRSRHIDADETLLGGRSNWQTFVWRDRQSSESNQQGKVSIMLHYSLPDKFGGGSYQSTGSWSC